MTTGSVAEQVTSVPGELHYLAPGIDRPTPVHRARREH